MKSNKKNIIIILTITFMIAAILLLVIGRFIPLETESENHQQGQIFLYGEEHSNEIILEKELELWNTYYNENEMRHLFVELPYYTAEFLNLWMQSDNDDILNQLYQDWEGTALYSDDVTAFYKQIKLQCPETIFHGTDVGHQYHTTGQRYLEYLEANGQKETTSYQLAAENIEQGKTYYANSDNIYRENTMTENFIREFDGLDGASIMGIYGSAHTGISSKDYYTNTIPCMANQLNTRYGAILHSEDLSSLARNMEALGTDTITINGKDYEAAYYGKVDLSTIFPDYQCREFWRLENAYDDFKNCPTTGNVLPYNNYPMAIETGQVFVIKYTKADGTVYTEYHRSDGNTWLDSPTTEEFTID